MTTARRILADFHCHSHCSPDCDMTPEQLVAAALRRGLGCIALTDHNTMANVREVQALAPFTVVPGEEIRTPYGEIIGLFLQEEIPPGLSPQETCDRIKEQGGLVVVPHPFDLVRRSHLGEPFLELILPLVDALEVKNARVVFWWHNARAKRCAMKHNLPMTAGSDCHMPVEVGQVHVEMPLFSGKDDFLDALRQGHISGRASSPFVHLYTSWVKQAKRRR